MLLTFRKTSRPFVKRQDVSYIVDISYIIDILYDVINVSYDVIDVLYDIIDVLYVALHIMTSMVFHTTPQDVP